MTPDKEQVPHNWDAFQQKMVFPKSIEDLNKLSGAPNEEPTAHASLPPPYQKVVQEIQGLLLEPLRRVDPALADKISKDIDNLQIDPDFIRAITSIEHLIHKLSENGNDPDHPKDHP